MGVCCKCFKLCRMAGEPLEELIEFNPCDPLGLCADLDLDMDEEGGDEEGGDEEGGDEQGDEGDEGEEGEEEEEEEKKKKKKQDPAATGAAAKKGKKKKKKGGCCSSCCCCCCCCGGDDDAKMDGDKTATPTPATMNRMAGVMKAAAKAAEEM